MLFRGFQELEWYSVTDSRSRLIRLYLPKRQWDYLCWLMSQGFDIDRFVCA